MAGYRGYAPTGPFSPQDFAFPGLGSTTPTGDGWINSWSQNGLTGDPANIMPQTMGAPGMQVPGVPTMGSNLGFNIPTAQLALSGLGTLGSLWGAFQSAKMAKKQFRYTKDVTENNLANQIKSYNTSLEDRIRSRAAVEGMSPEMAQQYLDRNRLSRNPAPAAR